MKKIVTRATYALLGILGLFVDVFLGLFLYYQTLYQETPVLPTTPAGFTLTRPEPRSEKPVLLPIPQKITWTTGSFTLPAPITFSAPAEDVDAIRHICKNRLGTDALARASESIIYTKNQSLGSQAYRLTIQPRQLTIEYSALPGLFYAMTTVKQLANQSGTKLPCVIIEDTPDLQTRGAMLDISRGKVPTLATLYDMVDFLSDLKYNQLQLYIEGFSFGYPSFKQLWEKTETPLTPTEIRALDRYCKDRFIELVPNQNSLGHMADWLKTDAYKDLAECPEGYKLLGLLDMKTTLNPQNPKSLALVEAMSEDLLPNFSSRQFNVNLDEPFELGKSKDHPINDPKEIANVYLNYAKQLHTYVSSKGKTMMMWGDVVSRNPEVIPQIPKDITLLEWRYERFQSFETVCKTYQQAGLRYMVCPGTSSWGCFTGKTDNMLDNVDNAVSSGTKHGALGLLMTDWGNTPHLQYLTVSYAGFAYAAARSWNQKSQARPVLGSYLSQAIFKDGSQQLGNLILDMGRYDQFEEYPMLAMTTTGMAYMFGIMDKTMLDAINRKMQGGILDLIPADEGVKSVLMAGFQHPKLYNARAIVALVDTFDNQLRQIHLSRPDSTLILDEYKNALRMIRLGALLKQYNNYRLQQTDAENKALLTTMNGLCSTILPEHERLWMLRNKRSGLVGSTESFRNLQAQINENLALLDKNGLTRWANRSLEKVKTAAAVLYLH